MPAMSTPNPLYPVFLKPQALHFLIVGGGEVSSEKLRNLLKSSPEAKVRLVAPEVSGEIRELEARHQGVTVVVKRFEEQDLQGINVAIIGTDDHQVNVQVHHIAKSHNILTNVADTPDLCDFYMGSIVTKGDLKIGISTNGQSPTFAKRFRQMLEAILPNDTPSLLKNLKVIRDRLKGDFAHKVEELNRITETLVNTSHPPEKEFPEPTHTVLWQTSTPGQSGITIHPQHAYQNHYYPQLESSCNN